MRTNTRNAKIIIATGFGVLLLAGIIYSIGLVWSFVTATQAVSDTWVEPVGRHLQESSRSAAVETDTTRITEEAPLTVETASEPNQSSVPAPEPVQPAIPNNPWAEKMTTAGIAPTDQQIAYDMLFTNMDWNVYDCICGRNTLGLISPESRFTYLNQYVQRTYGSWAAAQAQAAQGNW